MRDFKRDLGKGNAGEKRVIELLSKFAPTKKVPHTTHNYDLVLTHNDVDYSIEVKTDFYAKKSGNLAIEFHNSKLDAPSGLNATGAQLWVHSFLDKIHITTVDELKKFCKKNKPLKTVIAGGDSNSNMWIFEIDRIGKIFHEINEENLEEVICLLTSKL